MTAARSRIGNASGFYGDRFDAVREMLTGGDLDVLTGDYLAELTMLILGRDRLKDPAAGYAKTFLRQLEECLGLAQERGVRIVANAGGLNPAGLADAVRELADRLGVPVRVAHVEGDDLTAAPPGQPHRQRLPRRRRHRRLPARGRRHRGHRPGHRRGPGHRARRRPLRLGARRLRRARGRRRRRARPGVRHPGHRRQLRLLHASRRRRAAPASRSPRSTPTAPASSPSTPAPAALVDVGTVTAQLLYETGRRPVRRAPTSPPASTPYGSPRTAPTGSGSPAYAARPRRPPSRSGSTGSAAAATRSSSS